jgi:hypothetical protein
MDSILTLFFLTGSTGLPGLFFPGFPDESLETTNAPCDK